MTRIVGTSLDTNIRFLSYLAQFFFVLKMFQPNLQRERLNTNFIFNNFFFENLSVYEIMWKNNVQPDRPQMTVWCIRIVCWIPMATKTSLEYAIFTAFPLPQWLHKATHCYFICTFVALLWCKFWCCVKIHIIIAPTCFGLRPSSGSLHRAWLKLHFC